MRAKARRGFTLLEVLVATLILAVAVSALLSNLSQSTANLFRANDIDRLTYLAKRKMDELMVAPNLPPGIQVAGAFESATAGKPTGGWTAVVFPAGQPSPNGMERLERVRLECWLLAGSKRRTIVVESYRTRTGGR